MENEDPITAALATLTAAFTSLRVDMLARFDRVETRLTEIRDDITVNMGRADRAHEASDNTRYELRALSQEVATLTRKQRRLEAQVDDLTKPR
jgi:predicted  nucleic acid-binding Zn-ribbon protein